MSSHLVGEVGVVKSDAISADVNGECPNCKIKGAVLIKAIPDFKGKSGLFIHKKLFCIAVFWIDGKDIIRKVSRERVNIHIQDPNDAFANHRRNLHQLMAESVR